MGSATIENRPAFEGASFDKNGYCVSHPTYQLADPIKSDGRIVYEELKRHCPKCTSEKKKSKRGTSLGGGKVRSNHMHGTPSESKEKSSRSKPRREHDSPFDSKGRCHYHKNVQLAAKKMSGGWQILHTVCPKCMEVKYDKDGDDHSVRSGSSRRSASSRKSTRSTATRERSENAQGQFDKNGCCILHTHIQVAKKKVLGGWKVMRSCPACDGGRDIGLDDDQFSVSSKDSRKSARSTASRKSTRSTKSRGKSGQAAKSSRYGVLPFDGEGYCCQHPSIQIAQKKLMGGWKIIHDVCPDCADEMGLKTSKKAPRRKSGTGRVFDADGSDTSSIKSGKSNSSSKIKKKTKKVKNFKTEDENGHAGKYTGEVNSDYRPHGSGVMKYDDGTSYEGIWSEGSQVHGKMRRRKSKF